MKLGCQAELELHCMGVIHVLLYVGFAKRNEGSILIGNIIICNTNLHSSPSRKLPFCAVLAYSIISYDFMKSQVVVMDEAKQPWFGVAGGIFIYIIRFLCCQGFMMYLKNSV